MILTMETTNSRIKQVVLRRAHTIRIMRTVTSGTVVGMVLVLVSLAAIGREVWVARVIENMPAPTNILAVFHFFESAFMNTTAVVQILSVMLVVGVVWAAYDALRQVQGSMRFA